MEVCNQFLEDMMRENPGLKLEDMIPEKDLREMREGFEEMKRNTPPEMKECFARLDPDFAAFFDGSAPASPSLGMKMDKLMPQCMRESFPPEVRGCMEGKGLFEKMMASKGPPSPAIEAEIEACFMEFGDFGPPPGEGDHFGPPDGEHFGPPGQGPPGFGVDPGQCMEELKNKCDASFVGKAGKKRCIEKSKSKCFQEVKDFVPPGISKCKELSTEEERRKCFGQFPKPGDGGPDCIPGTPMTICTMSEPPQCGCEPPFIEEFDEVRKDFVDEIKEGFGEFIDIIPGMSKEDILPPEKGLVGPPPEGETIHAGEPEDNKGGYFEGTQEESENNKGGYFEGPPMQEQFEQLEGLYQDLTGEEFKTTEPMMMMLETIPDPDSMMNLIPESMPMEGTEPMMPMIEHVPLMEYAPMMNEGPKMIPEGPMPEPIPGPDSQGHLPTIGEFLLGFLWSILR